MRSTASVRVLKPRRPRFDPLPYALIAPIALLLLAISVYPTFYAIWLAMTDASLLRLARAQFIGIGNFVRMAGDEIFLEGLWRTLRWDLAVVLSELAIALPIAPRGSVSVAPYGTFCQSPSRTSRPPPRRRRSPAGSR